MKRDFIIIGLLSIIITILFIFFLENKSNNLDTSNGLVNSSKRQEWLFNRLKDPTTGKIPYNIRKLELEFASKLPKDDNKNQLFDWTQRGPYNVGGRTRGAAFDIMNENIIIAAGVSGGIWRSENGGVSWYKVTQTDQLHSISCIVQDKRPGKTNNWYAGTGEAYGNSASESYSAFYTGDGIYKSSDNGLTWTLIPSTVSNTPQISNTFDLIWNVAIDNSIDTADVIYVATKGKIYRSVDSGLTWTAVLAGTATSSFFSDIAITSSGVKYATMSSESMAKGIWRSEDGINWVSITSSNYAGSYRRIVMAINPSNENELYFLAVTPGFGQESINFVGESEWNSLWKYNYLSGNGAGTNGIWTNLSANIPNNFPSTFDNFYAQGSYNVTIAIKPDESNVVFIGGTNLYRSTDGFTSNNNTTQIGGYKVGTTFPDFKVYENHHPDQHVLFFSQSNTDILFNANDGGLFKTDNCKNDTVDWISLNNGYYTTQLYTIAIDENNENDNIVAGFQDNGNYFTNSSNPTDPWVMPLNGDGSFMQIANDGSTYYLSIQNGRVYKMALDNNGAVNGFARIDPIGAQDYEFINPFVLDANNNNIMYVVAGKYIWRNDSLNHLPLIGNYDSISKGWFKMGAVANYNTINVTSLAISKNPQNILYYGTSSRRVYRVENANTGDPIHTHINNSFIFPNATVSCIALDPRDANKLMVVYSNYGIYSLFYSEDAGANWSKVAGNLEAAPTGTGAGPSCRWANIMPYGDSTYYFVGTSVGMFYTNRLIPDSTVWIQASPDKIGNVVVEMIKSRLSDGLIAVATHGNGSYTSKLNITSNKNINNEQIVTIYPNPAKNYININSNLKGSKKVSIYSNSGQLIQQNTIFDNQEIKLQNYSTGIYYVAIEQNMKKTIKKLIINN